MTIKLFLTARRAKYILSARVGFLWCICLKARGWDSCGFFASNFSVARNRTYDRKIEESSILIQGLKLDGVDG